MKRWVELLFLVPGLLSGLALVARADEPPKPIRALLVLGGCCHDYAHQKDILTRGISQRAAVEWTVAYDPTPAPATRTPFTTTPTGPRDSTSSSMTSAPRMSTTWPRSTRS